MENLVDARGMACPEPVICTKKALEDLDEGTLVTIVDNEAARDNVITLAKKLSCGVSVEQKEKDYYIRITKNDDYTCTSFSSKSETVICFGSNTLGRGDDELGKILMKSFLYTLVESDTPPSTLLFINSAVFLTTQGSEVLDHLYSLEKKGVEILSCGTCLDFFKLKEKLSVGQVTNMYTILERLSRAEKSLTL